ncbi:uncharacterized protein DDB_G0286299-like [Temnothorax curvispinosus]|uniref:Uncharacterized protein DDB_G0286299-like n=1 Tax=Temnothorax curvispinosus TaxID=300111 RepID=A0A6J1RCQ2_9HYME|nr:uncharacterized protein DDB_G0286299-like [Temnothorax curvispinosus]
MIDEYLANTPPAPDLATPELCELRNQVRKVIQELEKNEICRRRQVRMVENFRVPDPTSDGDQELVTLLASVEWGCANEEERRPFKIMLEFGPDGAYVETHTAEHDEERARQPTQKDDGAKQTTATGKTTPKRKVEEKRHEAQPKGMDDSDAEVQSISSEALKKRPPTPGASLMQSSSRPEKRSQPEGKDATETAGIYMIQIDSVSEAETVVEPPRATASNTFQHPTKPKEQIVIGVSERKAAKTANKRNRELQEAEKRGTKREKTDRQRRRDEDKRRAKAKRRNREEKRSLTRDETSGAKLTGSMRPSTSLQPRRLIKQSPRVILRRLPDAEPRAAQQERAVEATQPPHADPAATSVPRETELPCMPPTPLMSALQLPVMTPALPPITDSIAEFINYKFPIGPVEQPSDDFESPSGESESEDDEA